MLTTPIKTNNSSGILRYYGNTVLLKSQRWRANIQQGVWCNAGRWIILCIISLSAHIQPTEFHQLFVVIFIPIFSIGCGSGLDIIKYQHSSKLCPLVATALLTMKHIIILFLVVPLSSLAQKSHICTYQDNFGTKLEIRSDLVRRGDSCNSNPATDGKPHRWQQ